MEMCADTFQSWVKASNSLQKGLNVTKELVFAAWFPENDVGRVPAQAERAAEHRIFCAAEVAGRAFCAFWSTELVGAEGQRVLSFPVPMRILFHGGASMFVQGAWNHREA